MHGPVVKLRCRVAVDRPGREKRAAAAPRLGEREPDGATVQVAGRHNDPPGPRETICLDSVNTDPGPPPPGTSKYSSLQLTTRSQSGRTGTILGEVSTRTSYRRTTLKRRLVWFMSIQRMRQWSCGVTRSP